MKSVSVILEADFAFFEKTFSLGPASVFVSVL